jgi:hypothetical protein
MKDRDMQAATALKSAAAADRLQDGTARLERTAPPAAEVERLIRLVQSHRRQRAIRSQAIGWG